VSLVIVKVATLGYVRVMPGYPHLAVVDDEEAIIEILSFSLQKSFPNATITGFSRADEAWDWLAANDIDLLITDLNMPEMDGQELVRMMNQKSPDTPVFIISGAYTSEELNRIGSAHQNVRIFPKPLLTRELVTAIKESLAQKELPSESQMQNLHLVNLVQMLHLQKKTVEIHVSASEGKGRIALKSGDIVLVDFGGRVDSESFYRLLALESPEIQLKKLDYDGPDKVRETFSDLLSEFCRRRDEGELSVA